MWYSAEDVLRLERERIFARSWQYAGRAEEVAAPGSFLAADAGGIPILVARDREGTLRAFLNVCRHRGTTLAEGAGRRETIQCPYHAWTYDLDGSLRSAPRLDELSSDELDETELSLAPAAVDTWGPFLFVNPDARADPLADTLGELPSQLDPAGLQFHSRERFELEANWKVAIENFLECYHCPTAHPAFAAEVDVRPEHYVLDEHPTFLAQHCVARRTGER